MRTFNFPKTVELRRTRANLEKKLNIKITITGHKVSITSKNSLDEYSASIILDAINFGFSTDKALLIKEEEMLFRLINIKDFTRKKNLKEVRARIIGTKGKTLKTIEDIADCELLLKENTLGIIGSTKSVDIALTALKNLIKGTKQSNVYHYLEKVNKAKKEEEASTSSAAAAAHSCTPTPGSSSAVLGGEFVSFLPWRRINSYPMSAPTTCLCRVNSVVSFKSMMRFKKALFSDAI